MCFLSLILLISPTLLISSLSVWFKSCYPQQFQATFPPAFTLQLSLKPIVPTSPMKAISNVLFFLLQVWSAQKAIWSKLSPI